ncbi:MAG TPA: A/G-specific adenine glycosylase [Hanamia sp.]|nr:A/G-specific adenine glycosylase [Hanamia sp.]
MQTQNFFADALLMWNDLDNKREMPWKGESDPYRIWISEIILQQTRVQQGLEYYNRFISTLPDVKSLATAPEKKVYKLWEGLGYYSRCKNLIATAQFIYKDLDGKFPDKFEDILTLKGVGNYTASAIASFAFNLPHAVVDGNVLRVLSRFFGIETPINSTEGKKFYASLAQSLLDKKQPGKYNQALMDFGAIICKPAAPLCNVCPLQKKCVAFKQNRIAELPVNTKRIKLKERFFTYLVLQYENQFYVRKRTAKDIWQNLYEFVLIESKSLLNANELKVNEEISTILNPADFTILSVSNIQKQRLTHQLISARFICLKINKPLQPEGYSLVAMKQLKSLPFPKLITSFLADKNVSLS